MKKRISALFIIFFMLTTIALFAAGASLVYVTPNGKKYHKKHCRTLTKSKQITELTLQEAEKKDYTPCKICGGI